MMLEGQTTLLWPYFRDLDDGVVFLTLQSFMSLFSPLVLQGRGSVLPVFATSLCSGLLTRTEENELGAADSRFHCVCGRDRSCHSNGSLASESWALRMPSNLRVSSSSKMLRFQVGPVTHTRKEFLRLLSK